MKLELGDKVKNLETGDSGVVVLARPGADSVAVRFDSTQHQEHEILLIEADKKLKKL